MGSSSSRGEEDDADAGGYDAGAEPVVAIGAVAVYDPAPQEGHDDEDAAVSGVNAAEVAVLEGGDDPVGDQDDSADHACPPGSVLTQPAPDQVAAADLGQAGRDEQPD